MKNESNLKTNEAGDGNTSTLMLPESNFFYYPAIMNRWSSLKVDNFGVQIPITVQTGMGQFWIPVFETEEECRKEYPTCHVMILKRS